MCTSVLNRYYADAYMKNKIYILHYDYQYNMYYECIRSNFVRSCVYVYSIIVAVRILFDKINPSFNVTNYNTLYINDFQFRACMIYLCKFIMFNIYYIKCSISVILYNKRFIVKHIRPLFLRYIFKRIY